MRKLTGGLAVALVGSFLLGSLQAAPQEGVISGTASAEAKQPYSAFMVRARDLTTGTIAASAPLDTNAEFSLSGLTAGKFMVELVRINAANPAASRVVCTEGPFDLSATGAEGMIHRGVRILCNDPQPVAAWAIVAAAAGAGVTAGVVAGGDNPTVLASPSR